MNDLVKAALEEDGTFRCDFTKYRGIAKCATYGRWQSVEKRVPVGWVPALGFGAALHEGFDAIQGFMMRGQPVNMQAVEAAAESCFLVESLDGKVEPVVLPEGEWRTAGRAKDVLGLYHQRWHDDVERFEIEESEKAHERELGWAEYFVNTGEAGSDCSRSAQVFWRGVLDGIWRRRDTGKLGFKDSKHTSNGEFETEFEKHKRSGQFKGYSFLTGIREAIVDQIIVRKPVAKMTSATKPRTEFDRGFWTYTNEQIEEWRLDTLAVIGSWLTHLAGGRVPQNDQACFRPAKCPYLEVCEQRTMKDRLAWLHGGSFKRNDWNPMARRERLVMTEKAELVVGEDY